MFPGLSHALKINNLSNFAAFHLTKQGILHCKLCRIVLSSCMVYLFFLDFVFPPLLRLRCLSFAQWYLGLHGRVNATCFSRYPICAFTLTWGWTIHFITPCLCNLPKAECWRFSTPPLSYSRTLQYLPTFSIKSSEEEIACCCCVALGIYSFQTWRSALLKCATLLERELL